MENNNQALNKAIKLIEYWKSGKLGGELMPEDRNPNYSIGSKENYLYFTLPTALNYQRNSYKLWESANNSTNDPVTKAILFLRK